MNDKLINNYKRNMKALKTTHYELYKRINDTKIDMKKYKIFVQGKYLNLKNKNTGKVYYKSKNIIDKTTSDLNKTKEKNVQLAIFLGYGLGYLVNEYITKKASKYRTIELIIIEEDMELFIYSLYCYNFSEVLSQSRISFLVGIDENEIFYKLLEYVGKRKYLNYSKALAYYYSDDNYLAHKEYYLHAVKEFNRALKYKLVFVGNSIKDSLIGLENMYKNLNEIIEYPGINELKGEFKNKPAVLVASGPSLKNDIEKLKKIQNKVLIICAQSTLKPLLKAGVKPHMVTSLERSRGVTESFNNIPKEDIENTYLVACPVIPPEAYKVYTGPRIVVYRQFEHFNFLNIDKGMLDIKRSSANMAFKIATYFKCDPIILLGQDLSFGENDFTHVDGTNLGSDQNYYKKQDKISVKGNYKENVYTCRSWLTFKEDFEIDISNYSGRCINATSGGAYIKGSEVKTFDFVLEKYITNKYNAYDVLDSYLINQTLEKNYKEYVRIRDKNETAIDKIELYKGKIVEVMNLIENDHKLFLDLRNQPDEEVKKYNDQIYFLYKKNSKLLIDFSKDEGKEVFNQLIVHMIQSEWARNVINKNSRFLEYELYERGLIDGILLSYKFLNRVFKVMNIVISIIEESNQSINQRIGEINEKRS